MKNMTINEAIWFNIAYILIYNLWIIALMLVKYLCKV